MPLDESNLAAKAARLIMDSFDITTGVCIDINKNIPAAAGLAGGSTNAAAVLVGLNKLWKLGLSPARLAEKGTGLAPMFPLHFGWNGNCSRHRRNATPLPALEGIPLVLVKPPSGYPPKAYKSLDLGKVGFHPTVRRFMIYWQQATCSFFATI